MNTYSFTVELKVEVEAFGIEDATDAIENCLGDMCDISVTSFKIKEEE